MRAIAVALVALAGLVVAPAGAGASAAGKNDGGGGAVSPDAGLEKRDLETRMAATMAHNPGSTKINDNQILLDPGVIMTLPRDGEVSTQGVPNCNYQWFCIYEHADYNGSGLAFFQCNVLYELSQYYFWDPAAQAWDDWAWDVSSWHNNQSGGATAWLYKWSSVGAGGELYRAHVGAVSYVGDYWNDQFWELYAC